MHWFVMIGKELQDPVILPKNVYNMDKMGVILCILSSVKVLISKNDSRNYRDAGVKRMMVTAIKCISADGKSLPSNGHLASHNSSKQLDHVSHPWMTLCVLQIWIHRL